MSHTTLLCHAIITITIITMETGTRTGQRGVMVRAQSRSFWRTIKRRLQRSLRWWPTHHCSVPPLPPATLVGLISELRRNTSPTPTPPTQPAFLSLSLPTSTMCFLPQHNQSPTMSTHVPCSRPITSCTTSSRGHESQSPQGLARIHVGIPWHHPEYESPHYMFILLPYTLHNNSLYVYVLLLYKYSSLLYVFC